MQNYHQSIEKHTLLEGVELILQFIEEFAPKLRQETKPPEQDYASSLLAKIGWGFGSTQTTPAQQEPVNLYQFAKDNETFAEMNEANQMEILQTLASCNSTRYISNLN